MAHNQSSIASEAFRVTGQFVLQLVAVDGGALPEFEGTYKTLYANILGTLQQQNIAQEIKQTAMIAMAKLISVAHKMLTPQ
jgi:phosphoribosylaminoimidazole carboxylase (NCAIR synthetase)